MKEKEFMMSAPCFHKKAKSQDFGPGIMDKIYPPDKEKVETVTDKTSATVPDETLTVIEPTPNPEPPKKPVRERKRSGPKTTEASHE